jgi:hypothetical protein
VHSTECFSLWNPWMYIQRYSNELQRRYIYVLCFTSRRSDGVSFCKYPSMFCNPNDVDVGWVDYIMPDTQIQATSLKISVQFLSCKQWQKWYHWADRQTDRHRLDYCVMFCSQMIQRYEYGFFYYSTLKPRVLCQALIFYGIPLFLRKCEYNDLN